MKRLQNKMWAKCLAFILCLLGAFGTLISCLGMCIVASQPKKSEMLEYCYDAILTSYAYEIMDDMDTSDSDWKESLERYQEKNWSFALIEADENKLEAMDLDNPANYEYISGDVLKEEYEFIEETSKYSYYEYNTNSLLSLLFGSTYYEYDDVSYEEKKVQYVVMDEDLGVFYVATTEGFIAIQSVCVQTEGALKRDFLSLVMEEDGEVYYILESTGERQSAEQIRNYNYVSEICNVYEDFPLYWHDGDIQEGGYYEDNHIYVLPSERISPRYYKQNSWITNYELTNYSYISYPEDGESSIVHAFYGSVNDELVYDDEIAQITRIIDSIYSLENAYVFIIFGCFVVFIAGLSFLIYGAGHRNNSEEITLRVIDRMPLEILTGGVAGIYIGLSLLFVLLMDNSYILGDTTIFLSAILFAAAVIVGVFYLISIAVRTKAKSFWKNTIIYFLGEKLVELCKLIGRNLPLFGKCLLVMVVLGIGETITLLFCWEFYWDFEIQIIVVVLWTLLETVLVFIFCYQMKILQKGIEKVAAGNLHEKVDTSRLFWEFKKHGEMINKARDGIAAAVEKQMKSERFRTELITNVSHDIKTPLTSIINYVDLIQKEDLQNEKLIEYVEVLDRQSNRLKKLIEDLMEASKASTGNLPVQMEDCNVSVLLTQLIGEYQEKLAVRNLELVVQSSSEPVMIKADGKYLWRVFDNLMNNICKYALTGTRVYLTMEKDTLARITFRNISRQQLNISSEELMERFVRGDSSRNTEGSGLGLSIAQSLTILMNGKMDLFVDGDLFKVILTFPLIPYNNRYNNQFEAQNPPKESVLPREQETADEQYNERD